MDKRVDIIGVPVSAVNMDSCVHYIFSHWEEARGNYICVSNVHTTVMSHEDPVYRAVQAESFLSVPDGKPLSVIGKKQASDMDRVTGPDLMRRMLEVSGEKKLRHFFYGNTAENLEVLIGCIRKEYPGVLIAGYEPSVFRDLTVEEETQLAQRIDDTGADVIWVALGAPRQEFFCWRMRGKIHGLMVAVGGAFNVLAGIIPEAPNWMQDCGMEWLYRLMQEPKRLFRRYLVTNTRFLLYLVADTFKNRKGHVSKARLPK